MESEAYQTFERMGVEAKDVVFQRTADMRHLGQFHEVETVIEGGTINKEKIDNADKHFRELHEKLYAFAMPWMGVEVLTVRVKATAPKAPFHLQQLNKGCEDPSAALKQTRSCRFVDEQVEETPIYDGNKLVAGNIIPGPAVIEERTTTVVIPATYRASVDLYKNYILEHI